jgi:hypothetical protein
MRPSFGIIISAICGKPTPGFRDTAGAVAAELAMVAPFLALLIIGVIDFGAYMNAAQQVAAATRVGAEYARDSTTCQNTQTGIDPINALIKPDCLTGNAQTGAVGIEATMTNSGNFGSAMEFTNMSGCGSAGSSCVTCECGGASATCGNPPPCSNQQVFVTVSASLQITPILNWPGFPSTASGSTQIRIQ